jgi:hypothetical protein
MFYDKVLADADLAPFFESIDMQKLKKHQVQSGAGWQGSAGQGCCRKGATSCRLHSMRSVDSSAAVLLSAEQPVCQKPAASSHVFLMVIM